MGDSRATALTYFSKALASPFPQAFAFSISLFIKRYAWSLLSILVITYHQDPLLVPLLPVRALSYSRN